jgi:ribonuclease E
VESEARAAGRGRGTKLLYSDQDLLLRALRDHLDASMDEVLVDTDAAYEKAEQYMLAFLPRSKTRLLRYAERAPLFERFDIEHLIDQIFERRAALPSGGSIVIDRTEALTAIDVNSGKATKAATQAETALTTNLEAAVEVARELRLRDIGGLVVVDFIDMRNPRAQRKVEKELKEAMKADRARFTVGRISPNGLLEINRQRIQQALDRRTQIPCPSCEGTGRIPAPETLTQSLLRRIEARASVAPIRAVRLTLSPEVAEALRDGRAAEVAALERQFDMRIEIQAQRRLQRHEQEFEWFDRDKSDPGPAPFWTETSLPEESRWTSLGVVFAGEARAAAGVRGADRDDSGEDRGERRGRGGSEGRRGGARRREGASHRREPEAGGARRAGRRGGAAGGRNRDRDRERERDRNRPRAADAPVDRPADAELAAESAAPAGAAGETAARPRSRRRRGRRRRGGNGGPADPNPPRPETPPAT